MWTPKSGATLIAEVAIRSRRSPYVLCGEYMTGSQRNHVYCNWSFLTILDIETHHPANGQNQTEQIP